MNDQDWKKKLTPEQYQICRQKSTEAPFTGKYWDNKESGKYYCVCCGEMLFDSQDKYESGSGWPSYTKPVSEDAIKEQMDTSHGMKRVEATCSKCGAHLGHVFPDGPGPKGLRFCINSASLDFQKDKKT